MGTDPNRQRAPQAGPGKGGRAILKQTAVEKVGVSSTQRATLSAPSPDRGKLVGAPRKSHPTGLVQVAGGQERWGRSATDSASASFPAQEAGRMRGRR